MTNQKQKAPLLRTATRSVDTAEIFVVTLGSPWGVTQVLWVRSHVVPAGQQWI